MTAQVDQLCAELEQHKARAKDEAKRLRDTLHNKACVGSFCIASLMANAGCFFFLKDEELFGCRNERDNLERERQKLAITIDDKDR